MSPIEDRVAGLLAELADARPVEVGTPPSGSAEAGPDPSGRPRRPDYVPLGATSERSRRRPVLVAVAAAMVLVLAVVGGVLVLGQSLHAVTLLAIVMVVAASVGTTLASRTPRRPLEVAAGPQ